jgi:hypothetical protein
LQRRIDALTDHLSPYGGAGRRVGVRDIFASAGTSPKFLQSGCRSLPPLWSNAPRISTVPSFGEHLELGSRSVQPRCGAASTRANISAVTTRARRPAVT